jgi:hypothetical protein
MSTINVALTSKIAQCSMCFKPTQFWSRIEGWDFLQQVPLCQQCSFRHVATDIPDYNEYKEKLRIKYG